MSLLPYHSAALLVLGFVLKHLLGGNIMNAVLLGGASMSIAAVAVRFVDDDDSDAEEAAYDE